MQQHELTIAQAHQGLVEKKFSSVELTQACLDRIEAVDGKLHSFLTVTKDLALQQARGVDEQIARGEKIGMLAGIPTSIKDIILVDGIRATGGSKILDNYVAPYDATVVKRLKNEGVVILGKTNCDEFAMGSSTENSAFGPTRNPWDVTRVPGGSSGGAAASVAACEGLYAVASDTGGSIRQPAAYCGITGLKPTYGAVSRYGLMAMASSLDQIGPLAKTVEDAAYVYAAIAGTDRNDSSSALSPVVTFENLKLHEDLKGLRIGLPIEYFGEGLDPRIAEVIKGAAEQLQKFGCELKQVSLPYLKYALTVYYIIQPCEVSANMARYDGIRYGVSEITNERAGIKNLFHLYASNRSAGIGAEVKRRIMLGTFALSAGYYGAYYKKAQSLRQMIREDFKKALSEVDVLIGPNAPTVAFKFGEYTDNPLQMYLEDIYTVAQNIAGVPGLSVPCGLVDNMPVGLQIIGKWWDEATILRVAYQYEQIRGKFPLPMIN